MLDLVRARREDVYRLAADLMAGKLERTRAAGAPVRGQPGGSADSDAELAPHESGEYPVELAARRDPLGPAALLRSWHVVQELHRALCELDDRDLKLVVLSDIEGLVSDQVAWLLDLSEAEVYLRLRRARRHLRQRLLARRDHDKPA